MAWDDERDFGMAGGRDPGPGGGGHPGIGMGGGYDVSANTTDIMAQAADVMSAQAGAQEDFYFGGEGASSSQVAAPVVSAISSGDWVGPDDAFGQTTPATGFSTATGAGGFTGGAQMYDMPMDPTFANSGGWGVPQSDNIVGRVRALREQQAMDNNRIEREIAALEQEAVHNRASISASDATQRPMDWYGDDEWGMNNVRTGWDQDMLAQQGMPDPNARRSWEINNPSPLASSNPGPIASHFPSPLMSVADYPADMEGMPNVGLTQASIAEGVMGAPGTYSGTVNPYDRSVEASLAFDEYEIPSRQQQRMNATMAASPLDAGVMPDAVNSLQGAELARAQERAEATNLANQQRIASEFESVVPGPGFSTDPLGPIGAGPYTGINVDVDIQEAVNKLRSQLPDDDDWMGIPYEVVDSEEEAEAVLANTEASKKSKKLTKEQKIKNLEDMTAVWQGWVDYEKTLKDKIDEAVKKNGGGIKGRLSKDAAVASREYQAWVQSDFYTKAVGRLRGSGKTMTGMALQGALKGLRFVEDIFHSWGKTERRTAQEILKDMKDNPEKYESRPELDASQLVRNVYPWLRKASNEVAMAAGNNPNYLRYLINLNSTGQPLPTKFSSNWQNEMDDAWIYD